MYYMLFHTFCEVAGGSPTQTCVDGVNVKMGPVTGGDNNYHVPINCLSDNKGHSQAVCLFDSYQNPVKWIEETINSFLQVRMSLEFWLRDLQGLWQTM